ncbi:ATP-binding cassette domain-containing protein [Methanofollis formosanus]|uniref:Molybdate/tungstate import ATP-binding protein WtpC n=1 Tax=Methanofollis formosanus TaxID=299308 RepID=A0A8G1EFW6_9EURY|nr:ATP-binding cassette domain-containing protein [Methanofollis formosanus]QYZ78554.1 ATP-binding cassette domain-containing protein [Methanofollis formosanus]
MIAFEHVSLELGTFALKDVSLSIRQGDHYCILGPSGAGKTVVLEAIAGLHAPREGRVLLRGEDVGDIPPERRGVALVYQDYSLFPHMTVRKNIGFGLRLKKIPGDEIERRVDRLLERFSITHLADRHPLTMSGGEQQRVAIARALATEPDILLLDEPFAALDPVTKETLMDELARVRKETGLTVVQVTHAREEALRLATRIAVIIDGRLVQEDTREGVFDTPQSVEVARFVGMENLVEGVVAASQDGLASVRVGERMLFALSEARPGTRVSVAFRAADVVLARPGGDENTARNHLEGAITEVVPRGGPLVMVRIDCGFPLVAMITRRSAEESSLEPGDEVSVRFKASAALAIPTEQPVFP